MPERFPCKKCGLSFDSRVDLMNHSRWKHARVKPSAAADKCASPAAEGGTTPPEVSFSDQQQQFQGVLEMFGVASKPAQATAEYVAQASDGFINPLSMAGLLAETELAPARRRQVINYWFRKQGVEVSAEALAKASSGGTAKEAQRWGVMDGRPVPDEEGEYTSFSQALKVCQLERQAARPPEDSQVKALGEEVSRLRESIAERERQAVEAKLSAVENTLGALRGELVQAREAARGQNEFGVMTHVVDKLDNRLGAIEEIVRSVVVRRLPEPMPRAQRQQYAEGLAREAQASAELDALEQSLFPDLYGLPAKPALAGRGAGPAQPKQAPSGPPTQPQPAAVSYE